VMQYEVNIPVDSSCLQQAAATVRGQDTFPVSTANSQEVPLDSLESESTVRKQESLPR
jgi:hypothetical protein